MGERSLTSTLRTSAVGGKADRSRGSQWKRKATKANARGAGNGDTNDCKRNSHPERRETPTVDPTAARDAARNPKERPLRGNQLSLPAHRVHQHEQKAAPKLGQEGTWLVSAHRRNP